MPVKSSKKVSEINTSSMADIAFLLLLFFLVTTTIQADQGLLVLLPPYDPDQTVVTKQIHDREILLVFIDKNDRLMVEGDEVSVDHLKDLTVNHVMNPEGKLNLASNPKVAIVSIQSDRATSFQAYLTVQNEVRAAYRVIRDQVAEIRFNQAFEKLNESARQEIKLEIPIRISEAEPTN